jgi:NADH-quinone oxidoreductase subunit E
MLSENYKQALDAVLKKYPSKRSAVIQALYLAQEKNGYLTEEVMREVAGLLDMDPTEVLSIAGFYTLLHEKPVGKYVLHVCNDFPCALRGADEFLDHICKRLGVEPGGTTEDGLFTVEPVMCIGACHRAPVMQVNLEFRENMTTEAVDELLEELKRAASDSASPHVGASGVDS